MSIDIRLKHSAVNGKAPQPSDLSDGELALNTNTASPAAYIKDSAGNIVQLAGAGAVGNADKLPLSGGTMTGDLIPAATGQSGYLSRTGTTLSPATAGDDVDLGTGDLSANSADIGSGKTLLNADGSVALTGTGARFTADCNTNGSALVRFWNKSGGVNSNVLNLIAASKSNHAIDTGYDTGSGFVRTGVWEGNGDVKIGGTLPASPNILLNANGSVSLTGDNARFITDYKTDGASVARFWNKSGAPQSNVLSLIASSTGNFIFDIGYDTGGGFVRTGAWKGSGDVLIGGTLTASPNITLRVDGSATFTGNITAPNVTSDIRFKENLSAASSQYDDVKQLSSLLKNWNWNQDAPVNDEIRATRYLGLIAQEAEKVCPSITYKVKRTKQGAEIKPAIYEEQVDPQDEKNFIQVEVEPAQYEELDDSYKAIKHDVIIMKLLGTVGELIGKVEALEAEVQALKAS